MPLPALLLVLLLLLRCCCAGVAAVAALLLVLRCCCAVAVPLPVTKVVNRKVGSIQWLRDSPPDVFRNFYQSARSMSGTEIMALCSRQVSTSIDTTVGWAENGQFLPLSVWQKDGWNVQDIEAKAGPEDIRIDPQYGWKLYRVNVRSTEQGQKRTTRDTLELLAKGRTRALRRKATDESAKSIKDGAASDDRSFSSESSDSQDDRRPLAM